MRSFFTFIFSLIFIINADSESVSLSEARNAAVNFIKNNSSDRTIKESFEKRYEDAGYYVFTMNPSGFIIITGRTELEPVYAYSFINNYFQNDEFDRITGYAISLREKNILLISPKTAESNKQKWAGLLTGTFITKELIQYPPAGTTSTEGWLEENWTQNAPYYNMCPVDPVTSARSLAGCPAVAMGSILNFHNTVNGVFFSDNDDYYHSYAGRQYYIDDDAAVYDFPSFPLLNKLLDTAQAHYNTCTGADDIDKAAVVFASAVACTQVFTSQGSGTYGVNQALSAYQKFNFNSAELLDESSPDIFTRMMQNIIDTLPVHLAVVDPGWTTGHNVVVDGYNTDGFFHLNFGWGGSNNGWYALPDDIPYNLTVIEGAIVDIIPLYSVNSGKNPMSPVCVSPNPASDFINITYNNNNYKKISLMSVTGQTIVECNSASGNQVISLPDGLSKGVYFVKLSGEKIYYQKIIIE